MPGSSIAAELGFRLVAREELVDGDEEIQNAALPRRQFVELRTGTFLTLVVRELCTPTVGQPVPVLNATLKVPDSEEPIGCPLPLRPSTERQILCDLIRQDHFAI
jgi:hypothetical protein